MTTESKLSETRESLRSDEPIRTQDHDLLARTHLVDVLSKHILHADTPEAVVIALNAPWGAGKSSFLNLLEQKLVPPAELAETTASQPIVIRFNPWHYMSLEQLVGMFFTELERGIGTASNKELTKKIGTALHTLGGLASIFHSGAGGFFKEAASALTQGPSLPELKRQLDSLLKDFAQRIVVFVDDIDRLERDALRLLFRMIRLNANFPNVTYVLAFDRLVVEKNLDETNGIRGRDYLEKIIQVSFDIPAPEPSIRHRILFSEMDAVLGSLKTQPLDQRRWGNVFHSGFKNHFRTLRHIKRYANGLRLTLAPVSEEVDLVDFLSIELLRVFHPEVYLAVAAGKDMIAPTRMSNLSSLPVERLQLWLEGLCAKASPGFQEDVRGILRELFPELGRVSSSTRYDGSFHARWRRECRVCSPEVFDKYFLLAIPEGEVSEIEMRAFVEGVGDVTRTKEFLARARETGHARRFMERLEDFTSELPQASIAPLVSVLFDDGDLLRFESRGMLDITADMQVPRIIYQCLSKLQTEQERIDLVQLCVKEGLSLYTVVQEVSLFEPNDQAGDGQPILTSHSQWERLRDTALDRITKACADETIWASQNLPYVLFAWLRWSDEGTVQTAVSTHVQDDQSLILFIGKFLGDAHSLSVGDKVATKHVGLSKQGVATFLDIESTLTRLRGLATGGGDFADIASELVARLERPVMPWGA